MSVLHSVGQGPIERVEYIGGLTIKYWRGVRALWRVIPITGSTLR